MGPSVGSNINRCLTKLNSWDDETAALQLFAHLEGEVFNVALLMPDDKRAIREGLSEVLSEYYNSPGRLAIRRKFRRKFDSVVRRDEEDPAAFATDSGNSGFRGCRPEGSELEEPDGS